MARIWNLPLVQTGSLDALDESRPVGLVTHDALWEIVGERLRGLRRVVWRVDATEANQAHWADLRAQVPDGAAEVVYAVGGGLIHDAAKVLAGDLGLPLVGVPTALTVDAFFTAAAGYREKGCVRYRDADPPGLLHVDFDLLAAAPAPLRAAGVCDVLSIATGCWDWKLAHERGRNPSWAPFQPWAHDVAQAILDACLDCCEAAGRGDREGLKQLFDCLALEVQLCNQIGHPRPEEGSEHAFAYSVENLVGHGLPHGDLVGPGIVEIARRQGQDAGRLERALRAAGVPLDSLPPDAVARTLETLPEYVRTHDLYYGIAHEL